MYHQTYHHKIKMKKNLAVEDRIIRFVLFDLLMGLSFSGMAVHPNVINIVFVFSFYLLITLILGYSPIYHILGISTIPSSSR